MKTENKEKLSALIDNELGLESNAWLSKLDQDAELKQDWSRYHQIGDLLRGHVQPDGKLDLSVRVRAALDQEPLIFAPAARQQSSDRQKSWLKSLAGVAIAATVATIAVLGLRPDAQSPAGAHLAVNAPVDLSTSQDEYLPDLAGTRWDLVKPVATDYRVEDSLNNYLVNHNEYAMSRGRQGMMPYVRIAGYDTERR